MTGRTIGESWRVRAKILSRCLDGTKHIRPATIVRMTTDIAASLRAARDHAGLTQRELAVAADIPQASVSRIERRKISPRADTIERWLYACSMRFSVEPVAGTGIDPTLLRERLVMTPLERCRLGAQEANAMLRLQRGRLSLAR